jgi:hypothetical protein
VFLTVNDRVLPIAPDAVASNTPGDGVTLNVAGVRPTALSDEVALPPGIAPTVSVATRLPVLVGVKTTEKVHVALGANVEVQVSPTFENIEASAPPMETVGTPLAEPPLFCTVNTCDADAPPRTTFMKSKDGGERLSEAGKVPWPDSATVFVPPGVAETVRVPLCGPFIVGLNTTASLHVDPGPSALVHVVL